MSEPFQAPVAPEATSASPISSLPPSAPAPVASPAGGAPLSIPGLASEPPAFQEAVQRVLSGSPSPPPGITPPPAQAGPPAPQIPNALEFFAQRGIQAQDPTVLGQAFDSVLAEARAAAELRQRLAYFQNQPPQAPPPPAPAAQAPATPTNPWEKHWNVPQKDPQWEHLIQNGYVQKNEKGLFAVAPEAASYINPQVVHQMNQWEAAQRQAARDFLANPYERSWQAIAPKVEETIDQRVERKLQEVYQQAEQKRAEQSRIQQIALFEQQNEQLIYRVDPVTGQKQFTPEGQFIADRADLYLKSGMQNPELVLQLAQRDLQDAISRQAPAQRQALPAPPAQPAQQPFLANALDPSKVQQALHNPSHVPASPAVAARPRDSSWSNLGDELRMNGRQILASLN